LIFAGFFGYPQKKKLIKAPYPKAYLVIKWSISGRVINKIESEKK
jgi:hypothetical protein